MKMLPHGKCLCRLQSAEERGAGSKERPREERREDPWIQRSEMALPRIRKHPEKSAFQTLQAPNKLPTSFWNLSMGSWEAGL